MKKGFLASVTKAKEFTKASPDQGLPQHVPSALKALAGLKKKKK